MRQIFRICVSAFLLSACFLCGALDKASGSFSVCNHTDAQRLLFAQAHQTHGSYTSSGYTEVPRDKCVQTVGADLRERWFYVRWIIAGLGYGSAANSKEFCVLNIPFTVEQADSQAACNKAARTMGVFSISR